MAPRTAQTEAFVLKTVDYGDNHVILTLLGRELGRFSAIARNARRSRKRFGGALLPLRVLNVLVTFKPQRDLAELDEAQVLRDYPGLESSYDKITIASYCTELIRATHRDHDDAARAFDLLDALYERLGSTADESPAVFRAVLHHFELRLLALLGHAPRLDACHRCGLPVDAMDKVRCGRDGHGVVCADCVRVGVHHGARSPATLTVLAYLEAPEGRPPDAIADEDVAAQVRRVIDTSLDDLLDAELRSRALLDEVLGSARTRG